MKEESFEEYFKNVEEYFREVEGLIKRHPKFLEMFGGLGYDMCNGGRPSYVKRDTEESFALQSLTEQEVDELMSKSEETGKDWLYEAVKDYVVPIPEYCRYWK